MTIPRFAPMLATPWRSPFTDPGWLFEVKWDGVRAILTVEGGSVSVRSRRGNDITGGYPELSGSHPSRPCVLDGEIVASDEAGAPVASGPSGTKRGRARSSGAAQRPVLHVVEPHHLAVGALDAHPQPRAPVDSAAAQLDAHLQPRARTLGLSMAMITRLLLLFSLVWLSKLTAPLFTVLEMGISVRDLVLILGGAFLLAKSTMELHSSLEGRFP